MRTRFADALAYIIGFTHWLACHIDDMLTGDPEADIWHDDDGIWRQIGPQVYGPFATEHDAERFPFCDQTFNFYDRFYRRN